MQMCVIFDSSSAEAGAMMNENVPARLFPPNDVGGKDIFSDFLLKRCENGIEKLTTIAPIAYISCEHITPVRDVA